MSCQLQELHKSVESLSFYDRLKIWGEKRKHYLTNPVDIGPRVKAIFRKEEQKTSGSASAEEVPKTQRVSIAPLGLKPGERVRVKSLEGIQKTLDAKRRYGGLGYMDVEMNKHCGGVYTVRKQVNLFFDERHWKMMKLREVVILDNVYCELPNISGPDWAGCDRTCFLFWKEAWLERLNPEKSFQK